MKFLYYLITPLFLLTTNPCISAAAAAGPADDAAAGGGSGKIVGDFVTPEGHYTRFYGLERQISHLYKSKVVYGVPAVPLLHPYDKFIHPWVGLAAKVPTASMALPKFATDLPGTLADHAFVVIQDMTAPKTHIVRLNYLLHTKDDERTGGIDIAVGGPTGIDSVATTDGSAVAGGYKRVSSHTHKGDGTVIASPNIGKLNFGKPAHEISTAAFWMVHRIDGVVTPTLFIIINDLEKRELYTGALETSADFTTLMESLSVDALADDPATLALKKALGYE